MSHDNFERIEELAEALDMDVERPTDPHERLLWLNKHRQWLHGIQELVLTELEGVWHEEQVARGELHGAD